VCHLRPILSHRKRSHDDTAWLDDNDDDDDEAMPEAKLDVLKGRLDLLEEADETVAIGNNCPGLSTVVSLSVFLSTCI